MTTNDPAPETPSGSWWRRAVAAAALLSLACWQPYLAGILVLLLVLIVGHEAGHFVVARLLGMKAPVFSVGFGPVLWARQVGETSWGVRAVPLGGFVRILGMDDRETVAAEDEHHTYRSQPAWKRVVVSAAGPAANLALAGVLLVVLYVGIGASTETMTVHLVQRSSPAEASGIRPGDALHGIDDVSVTTMPALRDVLAAGTGDVVLTVVRDNRTLDVVMTPYVEAGHRTLGLATAKTYRRLPLDAAAARAVGDVVRGAGATFVRIGTTVRSIGTYFSAPITGKGVEGDRMVSAIGLARVAQEVRFDLPWLLSTAALVNISLAAFNLVPVPPLDGGHIVLATVEGVVSRVRRRRVRVNPRVVVPIALAAWGILLLLGMSAMWMDVTASR